MKEIDRLIEKYKNDAKSMRENWKKSWDSVFETVMEWVARYVEDAVIRDLEHLKSEKVDTHRRWKYRLTRTED